MEGKKGAEKRPQLSNCVWTWKGTSLLPFKLAAFYCFNASVYQLARPTEDLDIVCIDLHFYGVFLIKTEDPELLYSARLDMGVQMLAP